MKEEEKGVMQPNTIWALVPIGVVIIIAAAVWFIIFPDSKNVLSVACGAGVALITMGVVLFINGNRMRKKYPQRIRELEIINGDERNIQINYKAKAKAFDIITVSVSFAFMVFLIFSILYSDVLMLAVGVVLCVIGSTMALCFVLLNRKYQKEM